MVGIFRRKVSQKIDMNEIYEDTAKAYEAKGDQLMAEILRLNRDQLTAALAYLGGSVGRAEIRRAVNFAKDTVVGFD